MSAWRIVVREVYEAGGSMPTRDSTAWTVSVNAAFSKAAYLGLLRSPGRGGNGKDPRGWTLTPLGRDYCEGRVVHIPNVRRKNPTDSNYIIWFQATWLASLPRGNEVRLTPIVRCHCGQLLRG